MYYAKVLRLVLGGALVAACAGSRLAQPPADMTPGGAAQVHARTRTGTGTHARAHHRTSAHARTRTGTGMGMGTSASAHTRTRTGTSEHARAHPGVGAHTAAAGATNKHNDFILLVKNNDLKKHVRNIMIVNKHNEDRLSTYNQLRSASAQPAAAPPAAALSITKPSFETGAERASRARRRSTRPALGGTSSTGMQRARAHSRRPPRGLGARAARPPPADILDMAPARGNRVNSKRLKGRLCQRHVLLPEGPKYDGAGRAYLAAHVGPRSFASTRRPRLLLPSCCNCCKKSVLGCE